MLNLGPWEDIILKDGEGECSFFDFCGENEITVAVLRRSGNKIERIQGFLSEYEPELFRFSMKGRDGREYAIPFTDVVLITINGRGR